MRWYTIVSIIIILALVYESGICCDYSPGDIEWATAVTGTLHKGGTLTNGNTWSRRCSSLQAYQEKRLIPQALSTEEEVDPMVYLEIYKNGVLIKEFVMTTASEAYIDPDYEAKVTTLDLWRELIEHGCLSIMTHGLPCPFRKELSQT